MRGSLVGLLPLPAATGGTVPWWLLMSGPGAIGGAAAGLVLSALGYSGLSFAALVLALAVLVVVGVRVRGRRSGRDLLADAP
jgi:drug/metabolite transporter (DMT)-like permease